MVRTTVNKVRNILDTSVEDTSITSWMGVASTLVDDVEGIDPSIPDTRLTKMEKVLTAHLVSTQDPRASSISGASRSVEFQGDAGLALDSTRYGQQAKLLDPTGTLGEDEEFTLSI